jgi:hypothetical protein
VTSRQDHCRAAPTFHGEARYDFVRVWRRQQALPPVVGQLRAICSRREGQTHLVINVFFF